MLSTPPSSDSLLGQSKRSEIDQKQQTIQAQNKKENANESKDCVRVKINGFRKHHMQQQLVTKCKQHVCETSPKQTQIFLQHAPPTPWKPPNGPT